MAVPSAVGVGVAFALSVVPVTVTILQDWGREEAEKRKDERKKDTDEAGGNLLM